MKSTFTNQGIHPETPTTPTDDATRDATTSPTLDDLEAAADANAATDLDTWTTSVEDLLHSAATLAGRHGGDLDGFVQAAYHAFLVNNPAARERLAEARMLAEIDVLRRTGRLGLA